ncbi:Crp/Fnr family transcriptional regulator [Variovorax paradoxus]|nr:Crp/Fnr family transcriptional regulator [Variovorax paradoxus]
MSSFAEVSRHRRGALLHRRGDAQSQLYVVTEGALEFSRVLPDGRTYVLPYLPPGQAFGLAAILADEPALFDVRTRAETILVHIRRNLLKDFLMRHPHLMASIVTGLSRRYCQLYEQLEVFSMMSLRQRLARVLVQLAGSFGQPAEEGVHLSLRISQDDLAALTAASRQRVHLEFRQLVAEGIVISTYGSITIRDLALLNERAVARDSGNPLHPPAQTST